MKLITNCLYILAAILISPMVLYRMVRHKRYLQGWNQRFGKIHRKYPDKKCIWIHAVSVGEVNATKTIVKQFEDKFPNCEIIISTTTDTGYARATGVFGTSHTVTYFPFDFSWIMNRAFKNIRPSICLLMELEVWPNFVQIANKSNIPVVIVNGRISNSSFSKYKKIKSIAKSIFGKVNLVLAQTDEYAQRFKEIGASAERVIVTGSLKYDTAQITDKVEGTDELANQLNINNTKLWVAGGTGNNEEQILLETFKSLKQQEQFSNLRLAIVPRKPERFDEVAQMIEQAGFGLTRYSQIKGENIAETGNKSVILGDTMGDLRKFYSLSSIIFVGRSLVPMGGSDMMEAAALGKCTIFGPHAFNFKQTVDALLADKGAIMVKDEQDLLQVMQKCLTESDFAETIARNGQEVIRKNQGATQKTIEEIAKLIDTQ
ncbi:MAG: 3-deoxy-D-manno-octulosonic acid transferase [Planctomycetes bacterium]|nr:3-deoxy-D-manno-octulosonic acid transferase [Planctomycetota bacterium]